MKLSIAVLLVLSISEITSFVPQQNVHRDSSTTIRSANPNSSVFLSPETAQKCIDVAGGTPLYAYSLESLQNAANRCLQFPNAFGLTVRYAMKACPNASILQTFHSMGIHMDASSGFEVRRAMAAGIPADHICLSTQELPEDFIDLVNAGIHVNACSVHQLKRFGRAFPGKSVGLRVNPGVGSGGFSGSTTAFSKTNVGGPSSSFGIWHETVTDGTIQTIVDAYNLSIERIHTHIGSGSDPDVWQQVAQRSLSFCQQFDTVHTLNLGGGYKVGRNPGEPTTDLQEIGKPVAQAFRDFEAESGRKLRLEIEPGTYLTAMAGCLISTVQDKVQTSSHTFLKLDSGMTDVLRPSLYGAIHPITILPAVGSDVGSEQESVVVVGHCCESGDLMTPKPGEPEDLAERTLRKADIGDILIMDGSGAYCSGMSTKNYNSFPEAPEVMVDLDNEVHLIRKRQSLDQIFQNEIPMEVLVSTAAN